MAKHARLGPSGAYIWTECTASPRASDGEPNESNEMSRMGTACHGVSAECLIHHQDPHEYFQREFLFCVDAEGHRHEDLREPVQCDVDTGRLTVEHVVKIDSDMVDHCTAYVNYVRERVAITGGTLYVEQRVPIDDITGEADAGGTTDVALRYGVTLEIIDAKFGFNKVTAYEVVRPSIPDPISGDPLPPLLAPNKQLAMYAGGTLRTHDLFGEVQTVLMTIVQPPLRNISEFQMPVADLRAALEWIKGRAEETRTNPQFKAGDHCTYCKARVNCQARDNFVLETAFVIDTSALTPASVAAAPTVAVETTLLGAYYEKLTTLRKWIDDIDTRVKQALHDNVPVIGTNGEPFKLVAGKRGNRTWSDPKAVEALLKDRMRLRNDEMYEFSLRSPSQVENCLVKVPKAKKGEEPQKPVIGERQWTTLKAFIEQRDGLPTIAPYSDPRPALPSLASGFEEVSNPPAADPVDLFL